ncbi:protease, partial [Streptomyces sp. RHZ10]|nr:protease [Streptomyces durocortorensis]
MDDGKPTGPQAKWWSRPTAGRADRTEPDSGPGPAGVPAAEEREPAAPGPAAPDPDSAASDSPAPDSPVQTPAVQDLASASAPAAPTAAAPATAVPASAPADEPGGQDVPRPRASGQPLHEPDEYSTPPYGGPGPWAPAPPVQRPTPAHGTVVPPGAGGPSPQYATTN